MDQHFAWTIEAWFEAVHVHKDRLFEFGSTSFSVCTYGLREVSRRTINERGRVSVYAQEREKNVGGQYNFIEATERVKRLSLIAGIRTRRSTDDFRSPSWAPKRPHSRG